MAGLMEYITDAAAVPFVAQPFLPADALALAALCYNRVGASAQSASGILLRDLPSQLAPVPQEETPLSRMRRALLLAMADAERYGTVRLSGYADVLDNTQPMQFSAMNCTLPTGTHVIAYRGTDNTLTGWHEDLAMSFESPVPAQKAAVDYLAQTAARTQGALVLTGHSKGGNLATYAAAHASPEVQQRLKAIYCFDGPGLDDETLASAGYAAVRPILHSYVPQGSVIGLLMGYADNYTIVRSSAVGLAQHDLFTWQLDGWDFETLSHTTLPSQFTDRTLHTLLQQCEPEQRRMFVDVVFRLLGSTDADTLHEIRQNKLRSIASILRAMTMLDKDTRDVFAQVALALASSGAQGAREILSERMNSLSPDQLQKLLSAVERLSDPHSKKGEEDHDA